MASTSLTRAIGDRIRAAREDMGWTQKDLAAKLGVSLAMVGRYERGINLPPADDIAKLSRTIRMSVGKLYGEGG